MPTTLTIINLHHHIFFFKKNMHTHTQIHTNPTNKSNTNSIIQNHTSTNSQKPSHKFKHQHLLSHQIHCCCLFFTCEPREFHPNPKFSEKTSMLCHPVCATTFAAPWCSWLSVFRNCTKRFALHFAQGGQAPARMATELTASEPQRRNQASP